MCDTANCPELLDPDNGRVIFNDRSEGSLAVYECESGYVLSGESSIECGDDGRWRGEPAQCGEFLLKHRIQPYFTI